MLCAYAGWIWWLHLLDGRLAYYADYAACIFILDICVVNARWLCCLFWLALLAGYAGYEVWLCWLCLLAIHDNIALWLAIVLAAWLVMLSMQSGFVGCLDMLAL